jgi:MFS family permease
MNGGPSYPENQEQAPPEEPGGLTLILRSLRHRNYRLFFGGQGLSLIGTWMQGAALPWMVFRLSGSPLLLGLVGFAGQILTFLVAPFAGVLADRWNRRNVLVLTQILSMVQAMLLTLVAFAPESASAAWSLSASVKIGCVIALSAFMGLVNGLDIPVRQAFVIEMVDRKEDLSNAIALNSTLFNGARLVGPAIAGILTALWGEGSCFLVNAVSYAAVIWALTEMRVAPRPHRAHHRHVLHSLREGWGYVIQSPPIRSLLLLLAVVGLVGMPYSTLMPVFAKLLKVEARGYGLLVSSAGAGALLGAIFLAARRSVLGLGWWIATAPALFGLGLIGLAVSRVMWLSMPLLVVVGFAIMVQMGSTNTILQTIVDGDKRGRVMSFHTMAFMGTAPLGALLAGHLADRIGPTLTVVIGGAICMLASAVFLGRLPRLRKAVRPIYVRMGILTAETNPEGLIDGDDV